MLLPVLALAGTDCERLVSGPFAQPANTLSSLAFLLAATWVAVQARRGRTRRVELVAYAVAVAGNAAGGIVFHGVQWSGARFLHDLAILSVLLFIAVYDAARLLARGTRWTMKAYASSLAPLGLVLALLPAATDVLSGLLAAAAGAGEIAWYRRELPLIKGEGFSPRRLARLGVVVVLALGVTAFVAGRSGAPLCNPQSVFQWHAVWHVLAALAMALYAYGAIEPHPATTSSPAGR